MLKNKLLKMLSLKKNLYIYILLKNNDLVSVSTI